MLSSRKAKARVAIARVVTVAKVVIQNIAMSFKNTRRLQILMTLTILKSLYSIRGSLGAVQQLGGLWLYDVATRVYISIFIAFLSYLGPSQYIGAFAVNFSLLLLLRNCFMAIREDIFAYKLYRKVSRQIAMSLQSVPTSLQERWRPQFCALTTGQNPSNSCCQPWVLIAVLQLWIAPEKDFSRVSSFHIFLEDNVRCLLSY